MTSTTPDVATGTGLLRDRERYVARGISNGSDVFVARASGARVWDVDGREYVDFAAGIGTLNVGHGQPRVVEAIRRQAEAFTHTCFHVAMYDGYTRLAKRLAELAPGSAPKKVVLLNSGAEAIENAVKIARAATGRPAVIAFAGAFHGRTLLGMTLTGKIRPYKASFTDFASEVHRAPYPYAYRPPRGVAASDLTAHCLSALRDMFVTHVAAEQVAAIVVEPVLGESGFIVPTEGFIRGLREICDEHGILLIADEIQTGFGRTGRMFAVEHDGVVPDMLVLAKSLAAGLPLSAVVGRADVMDAPEPGSLGGTYGGNPVACAAANAVLDLYESDGIVEQGRALGTWLGDGLRELGRRHACVGDVRGLGAMMAMELVEDRTTKKPAVTLTRRVHEYAVAHGVLLAKAGLHANVIRLLPPLTATHADVDRGMAVLDRALAEAGAA
jgi:4-aminobutyrate aminotransferase/(S)-3-amino-2-methylpropionate transaminase